MHANVHTDRNEWRLPPDETLQVADPKAKKAEVGDEEELALHEDEGHNWWSIIFSLLVIGLVISGIVAAIFLVGYVDELLYWHGTRMQFDEFLQGELTPKRLPSSWISHSHFVYQTDDGSLAILDTSHNFTVSILVTNHTLRQLLVKGYQCSKDLKYVLFQHDVKSVFRQSFTATYTIYDVSKDHQIPLRLEMSSKAEPETFQYVSWLGDTTSLLMVYNNDIYFRQSPMDETETRLTFSGRPEVIYNGIPDWLYQEDVLKSPQAMWSSHDGTHLLYATFNDSEVGILNFPWFRTEAGLGASSPAASFPSSRSVRFPRPGAANPTVQLWVMDISNLTDIQSHLVKPPQALVGQDYYLASAGWIGQKNTQVSVVWMNRAQNLSIISACLAPNWTCVEIHAERAAERAWLDIQEHPIFSADGDSFLMLAAVQEGSREAYTHIKHVTVTQQHIAVLSHGRHEVDRILSWDNASHLIYYLATEERKAGQRHLYVVRDPSTDDPRRLESHCITCEIGDVLWSSRYLYGNCTHFNALISPRSESSNSSFYVLQCEGPGLPLAGMHNATSHKLLKILYDTRLQKMGMLERLALPKQKSFEVPLPHGSRAQVQLLLPPSWREELRDAAYPVLVEVNGRPGSKAVTEKFRIDWGTYMSSHCDVVYIRLDVRGASGQSDRALFRHLGGVEVQDQVAVLELLLNTYKYLDKTRVGIWGWGYGGYVTSMVLGLGNQQKVYKCGAAVSPISDWAYYNSAFTEKILGDPNENKKGYVQADATQRAQNIPRNSFYLLHGMADLTAPYIHGVSLARALTEAGVLFRYQSYANEGHELENVLEHVYSSMQSFFEECLRLDVGEPANDKDT
ncbi:inactive dipeptidyl peptidase 10 isoform X2 [Tribolium castaneum]|uniref:inactive dipeptidyl peptidase 10 isoform X2 n=1 Tax=Tribolium castaneum TaxID=7070 RepID=UPI0001DCCA16|nr:PREDICTED: inactive dipeptidyl peptidase 10 isoform X2 [Tribolium castaneum]|eukprot:XP_008194405.1 PREDICTED: inactive dipeptidyl peptidase 10 isoform X2 [Tribolium castaneum]